jgi:hypothetical protein
MIPRLAWPRILLVGARPRYYFRGYNPCLTMVLGPLIEFHFHMSSQRLRDGSFRSSYVPEVPYVRCGYPAADCFPDAGYRVPLFWDA